MKKPVTPTKPQTIDLTPTWEETVNILLIVLENGTPEGKKIAREELLNIGRNLDKITKAL